MKGHKTIDSEQNERVFFSQKYTECYTMLWSFAYYQREGSLSVITEAKTGSLSIEIRYILATMLP